MSDAEDDEIEDQLADDEKAVNELLDGYWNSTSDAERESYLEGFLDDLVLVEILVKRLGRPTKSSG